MLRKICLIIISSVFLSSCATTPKRAANPINLTDLENLTQKHLQLEAPTSGKMRFEALKEISMSIGAQGGLAYRAIQINNTLELNKKELSRIFNFNPLILENHVLPPVMEESKQSLNLNSEDVIRTANRTYKIIKPARFVTTAPYWKEYLWLNYPKPELPDRTLLPRNKQERKVWIRYLHMGWKKGMEQADIIHKDNLARLRTDYNGMLLYRKLLAHNIVSKPFVAKSEMGITANDSEVRIDDKILRITANSKINPDIKKWKPIMVHK